MLDAAEARAREIRQTAEQDAEATRSEASAAAGKLLTQMDAIERPVAELVTVLRRELDGLSSELRNRGTPVDLPAEAVTEEPVAPQPDAEAEERRKQEKEAAARRQEDAEAEAERRRLQEEAEAEAERRRRERTEGVEAGSQEDSEPAEPELFQPKAMPSTPAVEPESEQRGLFERLRRGRRGKAFITEPGQCAVCQRTFLSGSEEELAASGWRVSGDVGLCPQCQSEGWQLPEGARLPFRRGAG
jgi:hypothetical protein